MDRLQLLIEEAQRSARNGGKTVSYVTAMCAVAHAIGLMAQAMRGKACEGSSESTDSGSKTGYE